MKHRLWDESGAGQRGCAAKATAEVAEWLFERGTFSREDVVEARIVKEANYHFGAHGMAGHSFTKRLEAVDGAYNC